MPFIVKRSTSHKEAKLTADKPSASKKIKKAVKDSTNDASKAQVKGKKSAPKHKIPKDEGYNDEHYATFKALVKEIDAKYDNMKQMKEILKKNDQKQSGTREELIERIADGELFGKMPRCPVCFKGCLQYDMKKGMYFCPGFYDRDHFQRCKMAFDNDFIQREQWIE